jgi:hypothetical protein
LRGAADVLADELDDVFHSGAGSEYFGHPELLESRDIFIGDYSAAKNDDIVHALLSGELDDSRKERHMSTGENRKANRVHVFLESGVDNLFRCLPETGVDYFHTGVAEGAGDDFDSAVVPVEPGLGE